MCWIRPDLLSCGDANTDLNAMSLPASRVLLIEDDLKMPDVLSVLLHHDQITLETATNASDALSSGT